MKTLKFIIAFVFAIIYGLNIQAQLNVLDKPAPTSISKALNQVQTNHTLSVWELERISGENDMKITIDAVEYKALNQTEILKGLRFVVIGRELAETDILTKSFNEVTTYLEDNEYAQVMVAIDNMIKDLQNRKSLKKYGEMSYITKGAIKIGYSFNSSKAVAYLSIITGQIEIRCESTSPEDFFTTLKQQIDIASKELYLPENAEKLKKVKKGSGETKDVNINDL